MYLHLYNGETLISEGTEVTPLIVGPLNATNNESSSPIALTLKAETGYTTYGDTVVSFQGTSAAKWTVCATADGTYAATLTITDAITEAGKVIYVKAAATSDETPVNDVTVDIKLAATVAVL